MHLEPLENRQLFATLTPGETYLTGIKEPSAQKNWTFDLVQGQAFVLSVGDVNRTSMTVEAVLIAPNGKVINRAIGENGAFFGRVAPISGTYRVRVRDLERNDTGSVSVNAFYYQPNITDTDDAFSAESGRRRAADIGVGDLDVWSIDVDDSAFFSVVATENNAGAAVDIGVLIVGPQGQGIISREDEQGIKIDLEQVPAGRYYAIVYEAGGDDDGRYGISFGRVPGEQYGGDPDTATPLVNGQTRSGDLPGGDTDVWPVAIGSGDTFNATLARTTGSLEPELLLVGPDGSVVARDDSTDTAVIDFVAPVSGTYWLIGRDREADDGGLFDLRFTRTS